MGCYERVAKGGIPQKGLDFVCISREVVKYVVRGDTCRGFRDDTRNVARIRIIPMLLRTHEAQIADVNQLELINRRRCLRLMDQAP